LFIFSKPPAN